MTNENTVTLFPCRDAASDGCPNTTVAPDTHCADCHLFYEEMAKGESLLMDDSWKESESDMPVVGFEVVEVNALPEPPTEIIVQETPKFDLNNHYTMNAAEVDCQAALFEIVAVLQKYQDNLQKLDTVLASYEVH